MGNGKGVQKNTDGFSVWNSAFSSCTVFEREILDGNVGYIAQGWLLDVFNHQSTINNPEIS
jgi:hypothetical protein